MTFCYEQRGDLTLKWYHFGLPYTQKRRRGLLRPRIPVGTRLLSLAAVSRQLRVPPHALKERASDLAFPLQPVVRAPRLTWTEGQISAFLAPPRSKSPCPDFGTLEAEPEEPEPAHDVQRPENALSMAELADVIGMGKRTVERCLRHAPERLPTPMPRKGRRRYWNRNDVYPWLTDHPPPRLWQRMREIRDNT